MGQTGQSALASQRKSISGRPLARSFVDTTIFNSKLGGLQKCDSYEWSSLDSKRD